MCGVRLYPVLAVGFPLICIQFWACGHHCIVVSFWHSFGDVAKEVRLLELAGGAISTRFNTVRVGLPELDLIAMRTIGEMLSNDGISLGMCSFMLYRKKRNRAPLDGDEILYGLDELSASSLAIGEALMEADEFNFAYYFNTSCLLVAERVYIDPSFCGGSLWKSLYFSTMEEALRPLPRVPEEFYFKVFPLKYEEKVTDENRDSFDADTRRLRLLYAIHLGAKRLDIPDTDGSYMKAPVPLHLLR